MSHVPRRAGTWQEPAVAVLLVAATAGFAGSLLTSGHVWGDDWAGYLMQAKAISSWQLEAELASNAIAVDGSDTQIGPYAYPWGLPLLLWVAGTLSGWSVLGLKSIGIVSLGAIALSSYGLARELLGRTMAALAVVWIALQPVLILDANTYASDLPFAALCTAALWASLKQLRRLDAGISPSSVLLLVCAVLSVASFSVRSNGAVTPCVYAAAIGIAVLNGRLGFRLAAVHLAVFAAIVALLLTLYFGIFPDGSLVHAGYLTLDPVVLLRRLADHVRSAVNFAPSILFVGIWKLIPLVAALALAAYGARRFVRREALLLGVYCGLHLAIVTVFRFDGGVRYYYPLLAPVVIFALIGLHDALGRFIPHHRLAILLSSLLLSLGLLSQATLRLGLPRTVEETAAGPYSASTRDAFAATLSALAPGDTVAFAKARAFRALTGRPAVVIQNKVNLDAVACYLHSGNAEPRLQVTEAVLRAVATRPFELRFHNTHFSLYCRK